MTIVPGLVPSVFSDLGSKLHQLSDAEVLQIVALLQRGGGDPKALKGLAILRPRLRELRPRRRLDARRVFCVPFEMLLSDDQAPTDPVRRIPRAAILSAWAMVSARLDPAVLDAAEAAATAARSMHDAPLQRPSAELWAAAATVLDEQFDAMAAKMGEARWLSDIRAALKAHRWIAALRLQLRNPGLPTPPEQQAKEVADIIRNAIDVGEDAGFVAALVAAAHFRAPGTLIGGLLDNKIGAVVGTGQAVVKRLCDLLGGDLQREIAGLQGEDARDPVALVAGLDNLAGSLKALQSFAEKSRDRQLKMKVEQALLAARSTAVDDVLPRMQRSAGGSLDRAVTDAMSGDSFDAAQTVEDNMAALRQARPSAEALGVAPAVDKAVADLLSAVQSKAAESPAGESSTDREARMMALARYVEVLQGPDAAQATLQGWLAMKAA